MYTSKNKQIIIDENGNEVDLNNLLNIKAMYENDIFQFQAQIDEKQKLLDAVNSTLNTVYTDVPEVKVAIDTLPVQAIKL